MRTSLTRTLAAVGVSLALAAVTSTSGFAQQLTSVNNCSDGRVGLMIQRADVQVSIPCALVTDTPGPIVGLLVRQPDGSARSVDLTADEGSGAAMDAVTDEIVGLVVQQSDGSVTTVDLTADQSSATQSSAISSSSTSSSSVSTSTSTSTTCVNGQCTTTTEHSVCADNGCSD
jgi:hypothetical protein